MKASAKANGAALTPAQFSETAGAAVRGAARPRKGKCSRIGRGQAAADRLKRSVEGRGPGQRLRRVVVKARIVKLKVGSKRADAHLRYLQRDGTARDGERGTLYGPDTDAADGREFLDRGRGDRHQFRFIVAPEDGDRLQILRGFTRDVMRQMEEDLGTKLDWVAVDHFNTGHPHSHIVIRGKDDLGKDLIIAQDYITDGLRIRAQERVTLELGPETDLELRRKLEAEISAERFTRLDRAMIAEARRGGLDLRPDAGQLRADLDGTLFIGRLQTLERYGLATEIDPGVWTLSEKLEPTLRELGERGDIVKAINRALKARGEERALGSYVLHGEEAATRIVGRVIGKRLTTNSAIASGSSSTASTVASIMSRSARRRWRPPARRRRSDQSSRSPRRRRGRARRIATSRTSPATRRLSPERASGDRRGGQRPRSGRRLRQPMSRVMSGGWRRYAGPGIVERVDADHWRIPADFETRAGDYDAQRRGRMTLRLLSTIDLEAQIDANGATWLDRELVSPNRAPLVRAGFGAEVDRAMERRREALVDKGHAWRATDGAIRAPRDLVARMERQEVERVGKSLAADETRFHSAWRAKASGSPASSPARPSSSRANSPSSRTPTSSPWSPGGRSWTSGSVARSAALSGLPASHGISGGSSGSESGCERAKPPSPTSLLA